ncbi:MAG: c-type cytochrome [Pseudomonadota bacterium]
MRVLSQSCGLSMIAAIALFLSGPIALAEGAKNFGIGRAATPAEVKAWDIDVRPDGQGLPKGKGTAEQGEEIFAERCASCHGDFAEGVDRWPVLAGGQDSLTSDDPVKTLGSYWPYLSTAYDYIYRAMPFGDAQSLTPDETYAIIAFILNMNNIIEDPTFELSHKNFTSIRLPNEKNFIKDPRPDTPLASKKKPCMKDCKSDVKITMRARILDVTPKDGENPSASID